MIIKQETTLEVDYLLTLASAETFIPAVRCLILATGDGIPPANDRPTFRTEFELKNFRTPDFGLPFLIMVCCVESQSVCLYMSGCWPLSCRGTLSCFAAVSHVMFVGSSVTDSSLYSL